MKYQRFVPRKNKHLVEIKKYHSRTCCQDRYFGLDSMFKSYLLKNKILVFTRNTFVYCP